MRIGLYQGRLPGFDKAGFDMNELIEIVRAAEQIGYQSFWMPEAWERDAFSALSILAAKTTKIELGAGVINVFSRSPALIAMSAATVDDVSGGRFRLGLGTSGARVIEDFHGAIFNKPLTRMKEATEIIRLLLSGECADYSGQCFQVKRFKLGFKPVRSRIPIYYAALSPKSLRLAGQLADGWLPVHWPRSFLSEGMAHIAAGAAENGRSIGDFEVAPLVNVVAWADGHPQIRYERAARMPLAYYIGGMGNFYHDSIARLGFKAEADSIREFWTNGKPREAINAISSGLLEAVAIAGPAGHCRMEIEKTFEFGATEVLIPIPQEETMSQKCRVLEALMRASEA